MFGWSCQVGAVPTAPNPDADAIEQQIARTQLQLRGTLDALAVELSPRTQVRRATERARQLVSSRPALSAGVATAVAAVGVGVPMWRRSR